MSFLLGGVGGGRIALVSVALLAACSVPQYSSVAFDGGLSGAGSSAHEAGSDGPDGVTADASSIDAALGEAGIDGSTIMQEPCRDGNRSPGETDVDCGGLRCAPCGQGKSCLVHADCDTQSCQSSICVPRTCQDGRLNQDESDIDCGGAVCAPCAPDRACRQASDCASRHCLDSKSCAAATCDDAIKNQDESGADCGGAICRKCVDWAPCSGPNDCVSGVCAGGICQPATCSDLVRNGTETYTDCGGTCAAAPTGKKCDAARACLVPADCISGICNAGFCQLPGCLDGSMDFLETDVDCGGGTCKACPANAHCKVASDCLSALCTAELCQVPTCTDSVANDVESDVDCGGGSCDTCADGERCQRAADCRSKICSGGICGAATCSDTVQNNGESAEDCGGVQSPACPRCGPGKTCGQDSDCVTGVCGPSGRCAAATCRDGVQNEGESDVDCGGLNCDPCDNNKKCGKGSDCRSQSCQSLQCVTATCEDKVKNGTETGEDCGGPCAVAVPSKKCDANVACGSVLDCASGVCANSRCAAPSCQPGDGVKNGTETDVDCGGAGCPKCADGRSCSEPGDCASGICASAHCAVPSCVPKDGVENGMETDVDCGGAGCPKCADGARCAVAADCASGVCSGESNGTCQAAACPDGVKNQGETDVDCGGTKCTARCKVNQTCAGDGDCSSGLVCVGGTCVAPSCSDQWLDNQETDIDCGGPNCTKKCGAGRKCDNNSDCDTASVALYCSTAKTCAAASCTNNNLDSGESDTDCGGTICAKCLDRKKCNSATDCVSGVCSGGTTKTCQVPNCIPGDSVKNGTESDVDCGGANGCPACADNKDCKVASDCASGVCTGLKCKAPQCSPVDGVKNGGETDTDCGGATCTVKCADGKACLLARDCVNAVCYLSIGVGATGNINTCTGGTCAGGSCRSSSCSDGLWGGSESDVDCGGSCTKCANGKKCTADTDCSSKVCNLTTKICQALGCSPGDSRVNGSETDVDCGGGSCPGCANGLHCAQRSDCLSGGACTSGSCQAPTCRDEIQNQGETDVDCGGANCGRCADNKKCSISTDCLSGVCASNVCRVGACPDGVVNNGETDMDCGGSQSPLCPRCAQGKTCSANSDCASGICTSLACAPTTLNVQYQPQGDAGPTNNEVKPCFKIFNTGVSAVPLSDLKVRYWFKQDGSSSFVKNCYYALNGCENLNMQFYALSPARTGADYYVELAFAGSYAVAAGSSAEFKVEFQHSSSVNFSETAHYSYSAFASYTEWSHVTLYRSGTLVWGAEPPP